SHCWPGGDAGPVLLLPLLYWPHLSKLGGAGARALLTRRRPCLGAARLPSDRDRRVDFHGHRAARCRCSRYASRIHSSHRVARLHGRQKKYPRDHRGRGEHNSLHPLGTSRSSAPPTSSCSVLPAPPWSLTGPRASRPGSLSAASAAIHPPGTTPSRPASETSA